MPTTGKTWKSSKPYHQGSSHPNSKLTNADIPVIRELAKSGKSRQQIAIRYGVHKRTISQIVNGVTWSHI